MYSTVQDKSYKNLNSIFVKCVIKMESNPVNIVIDSSLSNLQLLQQRK